MSGQHRVGDRPLVKVSSGSLEEGVKRSMSMSPRGGDQHQPKRLRISDQCSWSCTSSSDERAKRLGAKYRKRSEDSVSESCGLLQAS